MARGSFTALWLSQALSQLGTSVSSLAYPLLVFEVTGSALSAGAIGTVTAATALLTRLPGGAVADRFDRRWVMLVADGLRAVIVLLVAFSVLTGAASLPLLLVAVALEVGCGAAFAPAEFALLRSLVPPTDRALAVGRMQSRSALAGLIGPTLGGALYSVSPWLPFAVDAASYAASFVLVLTIRSPRGGAGPRSQKLSAGWRWLTSQRFLLVAGVWTAALTAVFGGVGLLLLVIAVDRGASPTQTGLMYTISAAGGFVGALTTPALQRRWRPRTILRAAAIVDCLAAASVVPLHDPLLIGVAGAVAFFLAPAVTATMFGQLAMRAPDAVAGSAQAALGLTIGAVAPIAPVGFGALADGIGPTGGIIACAVAFGFLAVGAFVAPAFRDDRPAAPPDG